MLLWNNVDGASYIDHKPVKHAGSSTQIQPKARARVLAVPVGDAIGVLAALSRHLPDSGGGFDSMVNDRGRGFHGRLVLHIDPDR